jgi:hypothetical protein
MKVVKLALLVTATVQDGETEQTAEAVRQAALEQLDGNLLEVYGGKARPGDYRIVVNAAGVADSTVTGWFAERVTIWSEKE